MAYIPGNIVLQPAVKLAMLLLKIQMPFQKLIAEFNAHNVNFAREQQVRTEDFAENSAEMDARTVLTRVIAVKPFALFVHLFVETFEK